LGNGFQQPPRDPIAEKESSLDQLLADYRAYGLPLPPDRAKLVRFESGRRQVLNDKADATTYFLGFLLPPGTKDNADLLLVGTEEIRVSSLKNVEVVGPKAELVKSIDVRRWG